MRRFAARPVLSDTERRQIEAGIAASRDRRAASIGALLIVQRHRGCVSDAALRDLAPLLDMSVEELEGLATFYSLIFRRPVGRRVLKVCDSAVCWQLGGESMMQYLERRLGIARGETTSDGEFTLLPISCLGDCDHAPVMLVNDTLVRELTEDVVDRVLSGEPPETE